MAATPSHPPSLPDAAHAAAPAEPGAHTETAGHEGGSGGLPQFDPTWWPGQAAWFLIIFLAVLVLMRTVFVPRIGGAITAREDKINGDIAEARRLKGEADAQAQEAASEMAAARASAQKVASDARGKAQAEIAARMAEEEAKLAKTQAAAEARIGAARDEAMGNVKTIAADTAEAIVERLTGKPASAQEVKAALVGQA